MLVKFTILASRYSLEVGLSSEGQNPDLYETSLRNVPVKWVLSNSLTCKCSLAYLAEGFTYHLMAG